MMLNNKNSLNFKEVSKIKLIKRLKIVKFNSINPLTKLWVQLYQTKFKRKFNHGYQIIL